MAWLKVSLPWSGGDAGSVGDDAVLPELVFFAGGDFTGFLAARLAGTAALRFAAPDSRAFFTEAFFLAVFFMAIAGEIAPIERCEYVRVGG